MERRNIEARLVEAVYGPVEVGNNLDWFVVPQWQLLEGWNMRESPILVLFPPGYPVTPPDNFYAAADLRLTGGALPGNTSPNQQQAGRQWLMFSFHIEPGFWQPHAEIRHGHNMLTFLEGVARRLREAN